MNTTSSSRAGSFVWVKLLEISIKQLQNQLKKVENSIMNNLQLESLKSDFVWESYSVWKVRKNWEKNLQLRYSNFSSF